MAFPVLVHAAVKLPAFFSDHMVLQSGTTIPVWGWSSPDESVTVKLAGQSLTTTATAEGKWHLNLPHLKATAEPQTLTVTGKNKLTVRDVLIGEVWLCSGQSNMAMPVRMAKDYERERSTAALPQIRMFTVASGRAETPQEDCAGAWVVCSPDTVGNFSATAYFFGRELHRTCGGAIGLVHSSVGGTLIESWIAEESQRATPALKPYFDQREKTMAAFDHAAAATQYRQTLAKWETAVEKAKAAGQPAPGRPSDPLNTHLNIVNVGGLFNGKIAPLVPYALRGVIWYQGESNATPDRAPFYETQMHLLVQDWRRRWGSELPFAWVQLPNVKRTESWAQIREAQLHTLDLSRTGMAVTIDLGESRNLHPANKQDIGRRLAQWALGSVYGKGVVASGPLPAGHEVRGHEIVVRFRHVDGGLKIDSSKHNSFVVAGANRVWKPAQVRVENDAVVFSSPEVPQPIAVRYAWAADPACTLYNGAGLPASPFRTDEWPLAMR